jgi:hypothetical protein
MSLMPSLNVADLPLINRYFPLFSPLFFGPKLRYSNGLDRVQQILTPNRLASAAASAFARGPRVLDAAA